MHFALERRVEDLRPSGGALDHGHLRAKPPAQGGGYRRTALRPLVAVGV
jgi:hypothetical protein